jgi:flagellar hook-length control protein FliK
MPANATLAIFAAKAPIEPTAPTRDRANDNGFKDFMDTAAQKVESTQKPSQENSPQNQNDTQAGKTQSPKTKTETRTKDDSGYQEVSTPTDSKPQSAPETVSKDSVIEGTEVLAAQLQQLDISQAQFEALLNSLGLNGDTDMEGLLQSLAQALNLNQTGTGEEITPANLIARLQQNKGEAVDLLKQSGLTDAQAKALLDQLQSLQNASAQKELAKNANLQAKIDSQVRRSDEVVIKNPATDTGQDDNDEGSEILAQFKDTTKEAEKNNLPSKETEKTDPLPKGTEKTDRFASAEKLQETPRITNQEPVNEKGGKASNLGELLGGKNAQANILQTENFTDSKGLKGLETAKTGPDLQVQSPTTTANTAVKAVESSKPILPENLLARGATEAKIINQIANRMTVRSNGAENEIHIKLDPPSLGTVRMNITTSGDSVRTVIVAENHAVKQVIENNFNQLRDAMAEQGLKVDSFTVTVGGESGHQNPSGESFGEGNNPSSFDQTADTNETPETGTVSMFFGDNQSISVIA